MAIIIQSTNLQGAGPLISLTSSDDLYVVEGVVVAATSGDAINAAGSNTVTIAGEVVGNSAFVDLAGDNIQLTITPSGVVTALTFLGSDTGGIIARGDNIVIHNHGTVTGGGGIGANGADDIEIYNTGYVSGAFAFAFANLNFASAGTGTIVNTGYAFGSSYGYYTVNHFTSDTTNFTNTGYFGGDIAAYVGGYGVDNMTNMGVIDGDVYLESGDDIYDGRGGTVLGEVRGGGNDDTFIVDNDDTVLVELAGQGTDEVRSRGHFALGDHFENLTLIGSANANGTGNDLANTITGNSGANRLAGREGADDMTGRGGNDRLRGGNGNDTLNGGNGDDTLIGNSGNDNLTGGRGGDSLKGGRGDDTLGGNNGDDILRGGLGEDVLTGGSGADLFVFARRGESLPATNDVITDFEPGTDKIDLGDLVDGRLSANILSAFSGSSPQIRTTEGTGNTRVLIDTNGDGGIDMKITVQGVLGLTEDDFIL